MNVYHWRKAIGDLPGARWEPRTKYPHWQLPPTPGSAAALLTILAGSGAHVSEQVSALAREGMGREHTRARILDERRPLPDLPYHEWLRTSPWPHQKRGIAHFMEFSTAVNGSPMGGGKTLTAVGAMNARGFTKVLIVSPSSALGVFPREFRLHSPWEWHTENGIRRTRTGSLKKLPLPDRWKLCTDLLNCPCGKPHAAIVTYAALTADPLASADLGALGVELVLFDEVHKLRSAGGEASWTAASWVPQVGCRWGLSGTLLPQSPDDIYGIYRTIDPSIFGTNKADFRARYIVMAKTRDDRDFPKDVYRSMRFEYSQKLHSVAYFPVVDLKLPPVSHSIRMFELEPSARRVYNQIRDEGVAEISAAVAAAGGAATPEGDERTVSPTNDGVQMLRWAQITGGSVTDDDGAVTVVSTAKADLLAEVLDEVGCRPGGRDGASDPEPVLVFCRFRPDLAAIRERAEKAGLRYAEISGSRKDGLTETATMNPHCDIVAVQIASGAEGIDLTRARVVIWYSVGFELWLFLQAQARAHRKGQTRSVLNIYLVADSTIDGIIYGALARRQNVVQACLDAYLAHEEAQRAAELPAMPVEIQEQAQGALPALPAWLLDEGSRAPRRASDPQRDAEAAALANAGMRGL